MIRNVRFKFLSLIFLVNDKYGNVTSLSKEINGKENRHLKLSGGYLDTDSF